MAEFTGISWTDSTANFWIGCTKVSPACDNCYAERDWDLRKHRVTWGPAGDRSYVKAGWALIRKFDKAAKAYIGVDPVLKRRRRIFVNSLSDIGDNHPSILWHEEAFKLCEESTAVDLLFVTKRPKVLLGLIKRYAPHWLEPDGWPAHIWVYVTVEDQDRADERREALRAIPAKVRGVSYEPALGPVDWSGWDFVQSIIAGGESGPKARPSHPDWFRNTLRFCSHFNIAFHFKQWGEWKALDVSGDGEWPADGNHCAKLDYTGKMGVFHGWPIQRCGKKIAGRTLDGAEHDAMPVTPEGQPTFKARCGECDHKWIVAYLPLPLEEFAKQAKDARCPKGCDGKVYCA